MKYCPQCNQEYPETQRFCLSDGQLLSLPDPYHLVGRTLLDKYRIDALIGIGGMGAVYAASHLTISRRVAFKILQPNLTLGNKRLLALFQREAELAGQLSHENVVDVKDAGSTPDGIAYIVMEWLEGPTLDEVLVAERRLSFERTLQIMRQIATALDHAHSRHIIHRDLKPSNIMLVRLPDGRERVKVVDFGIAKVASETTASPVSRLMGTPHYASPEQFRFGSHIDGRADIYSLGVMLYQMIAGELPFSGETAQELIRLQSTQPPPPLRQFRPEAPAAVEQLIERMLAKEPRERPSTASQAVAILERAFDGSNQSGPDPAGGGSATLIGSAVTSEYAKAPETVVDRGAPTQLQSATKLGAEAPPEIAPERTAAIPESAEKDPGRRPTRNSSWGRLAAAAVMVALIAGAVAAFYRTALLPPRVEEAPLSKRVELMDYYLEISSDQCQTLARGSGDETLKEGQAFKFHFSPKENGYLYIVAPNEQNVPTTFLTAQPHPDTGVKSNYIEAGADYGFPAGQGNCIGISPNEQMMAFTVIFSPTPLASPSYLTAQAMRPLTATEQNELAQWRRQFAASAPQISPEAGRLRSRVTLLRKSGDAEPVIFELPIKRQ
jgi:serine/threonine protein kinase